MTRRFSLGSAAVAVALAWSAPVLADPASDAKDLFTRGRELRARGDCASAVVDFRKAYELYPAGLGSLRNLAECEESLGHYASSRRAWLDLNRALITNDDRKYDGWGKDAEDASARLAPKLATLTVDVSVVGPGGETAAPRGVDVVLDGEKLAPPLVGTPLERDPGHHVVRVSGARVQGLVERAVDLVAGDAKRVALRVVVSPETPEQEPAAGPSSAAPVNPVQDDEARARATKRTIGWVAVGVGAASLVGAVVSLVVRQSAIDTVNGQCPSNTNCDPGLEPTVSRGQTASALFTGFGIVGVVGVAGGVVLLATSGGPSPQARLVVTPGLGGASATWTF